MVARVVLDDPFTVRDLGERIGDLIRGAEEGKLAIITKHGVPVFVALPFDETLVREGIHVALAIRLFDEEQISLGKAAQLAGMNRASFTDELARQGIPVIRTTAEELERELAAVAD